MLWRNWFRALEDSERCHCGAMWRAGRVYPECCNLTHATKELAEGFARDCLTDGELSAAEYLGAVPAWEGPPPQKEKTQ